MVLELGLKSGEVVTLPDDSDPLTYYYYIYNRGITTVLAIFILQ